MTKITAVLVRPLAEQADRDGWHIDPAGVKFDPDKDYIIWREFSYNVPDDVVGHGRVRRREDGALVVDGELTIDLNDQIREGRLPFSLAIGVMTDGPGSRSREPGGVCSASSLMSIGFTAKHSDPDQPEIEIRRDTE